MAEKREMIRATGKGFAVEAPTAYVYSGGTEWWGSEFSNRMLTLDEVVDAYRLLLQEAPHRRRRGSSLCGAANKPANKRFPGEPQVSDFGLFSLPL